MLLSLIFKDLKKPPSFLSPHFIAIIDVFHLISKNLLDNSEIKYYQD
jgi:hypothetical protein